MLSSPTAIDERPTSCTPTPCSSPSGVESEGLATRARRVEDGVGLGANLPSYAPPPSRPRRWPFFLPPPGPRSTVFSTPTIANEVLGAGVGSEATIVAGGRPARGGRHSRRLAAAAGPAAAGHLAPCSSRLGSAGPRAGQQHPPDYRVLQHTCGMRETGDARAPSCDGLCVCARAVVSRQVFGELNETKALCVCLRDEVCGWVCCYGISVCRSGRIHSYTQPSAARRSRSPARGRARSPSKCPTRLCYPTTIALDCASGARRADGEASDQYRVAMSTQRSR